MQNFDLSADLIQQWIEQAGIEKEPVNLYAPIAYTLASGGKRLRPMLLLASHLAFGGDAEQVRPQCLGIEMFHNFTLLHDDVMDNADLRRGRATVHKRWDVNTAILSGDAMLTMAGELMADCETKYIKEVLRVFNGTAMEVYEGQQLDMDFENRTDVTVDEYMEMIRLKTSVLLACALKIGAILAGASAADTQAIYNYGINLGLGFQLRDDYLDTFGDPLLFGKEIGGDIVNNKQTYLMISARCSKNASELEHALKDSVDDKDKISAVTNIYLAQGLDRRILDEIKGYSRKAIACLDSITMSDDARKYFEELAHALVDRTN